MSKVIFAIVNIFEIMANKTKRGNKTTWTTTSAGAAAKTLNWLKTRHVYHQPNPPQHPMNFTDETTMIDLCFLLFVVITLHLGPALWTFLTRRALYDVTSLIVDTYKFIKDIIGHRVSNPAFFTTNSPSDLSHLQTAQNGRMAVAHGYYDEISKNWSPYMLSWIEVLKMVDSHQAAAKVQNIHDQLLAGNLTALDILLCSYTSPDFVEHGTKIKKPTDLTKAEYLNEVKLQTKLFQCLSKILGPALRDENLARTGQVRLDSEIDCQNLLYDLYEHWLKQPQHPDMLANVQLLELAIRGRNKVCHAEFVTVATHWESYLKSWEDVCTLISNPTAAQNISAFHAELKAQRNVPFTTGSFLSGPMKASIRSKTMIRIKLTKKPV
jgi:hypothetical protein